MDYPKVREINLDHKMDKRTEYRIAQIVEQSGYVVRSLIKELPHKQARDIAWASIAAAIAGAAIRDGDAEMTEGLISSTIAALEVLYGEEAP
jgi:hypothetical protein